MLIGEHEVFDEVRILLIIGIRSEGLVGSSLEYCKVPCDDCLLEILDLFLGSYACFDQLSCECRDRILLFPCVDLFLCTICVDV